MERIGILGGTFDPPHRGHITLAQAAFSQLALDSVWWVPTGQPAHKKPRTAVGHRIAMIDLITQNHDGFELCMLDVDRPGPHFTSDLLLLIRNEFGPQLDIWFLLGQDSLHDLYWWHKPEQLLDLCRLAVFPRPGKSPDWAALQSITPAIKEKIDWLQGKPLNLSSRMLRQRIRAGKPIDEWVPKRVCDYIATQKLYFSEFSPRPT